MKIRKSNIEFRDRDLNLFKFAKEGILMTFNRRTINLSNNVLIDKNGCLEWLESLLDEDLAPQQKRDIKEVIKELN